MKISFASDLHLEKHALELRNVDNADVLILAGDICEINSMYRHAAGSEQSGGESYRIEHAARFRKFFKEVSERFDHVLYVLGNHELYDGKWIKYLLFIQQELSVFPNISVLERDTRVIGDTTFVGGTLWTDLNKEDPLTVHGLASLMSDYKYIKNDSSGYRKLTPRNTLVRHRETLGYFKEILDRHTERKCVVISHHAPCSLSIQEKYRDKMILNGGYYSDLSDFILDRPQIKLWVHGHVHHQLDYSLGDTRVVCNPRGYPSDKFKYPFNIKTIEL